MINSSSKFPNRAVTNIFIVPKSLSDLDSEGLIFKTLWEACPQTPLRQYALDANVLCTLRCYYALYFSAWEDQRGPLGDRAR